MIVDINRLQNEAKQLKDEHETNTVCLCDEKSINTVLVTHFYVFLSHENQHQTSAG